MGGGTPWREPTEIFRSFTLQEIGIGRSGLMRPTVYDTAWLAQVPTEDDLRTPAFPQALDWVRQTQHLDGSWGAEIEYVHDRVISTMTAILALAKWEADDLDKRRIGKGISYIWKRAHQLGREHETIGFEVILPTLLKECALLGLALPKSAFARYSKMRQEKMAKIPPAMLYSRDTSMTFSFEFMGDNLDVGKTDALQENNGSIGVSPSATAYFLTKLPNNVAARRYVTDIARTYGGKAPQVYPFDIFETAWSLWNLALAGVSLQDQPLASHVADLARLWEQSKGRGVGFSSGYSAADADDTAMLLSVLRRAGHEPDLAVFDQFKRRDYFVCYPWERDNDSSLSVNIHVLDVLRGLDREWTAKIVDYLRSHATAEGYWQDKWHISPYYTTAHAVIALIGCNHELAKRAVSWIIDTQQADGRWGYQDRPTAEETAYCMQALGMYNRHVEPIDRGVLARGRAGLLADTGAMPPLWIGKCLYTPIRVVESAICSALALTK